MQVYATRKDAHDLMIDACHTLTKVSANGIRIDTQYLHHAQRKIAKQITSELDEFEKLPSVKLWKKKYSEEYNHNSGPQLADILFNELGYESKKITKAGKEAIDVNVLEELVEETNDEMLKCLMHIRKIQKASGTYIEGILRETTDNYLHPNFPLFAARSYRSACLAKGTRIMVNRGYGHDRRGIPIERIKAGDLVYCFDDNLKPALRRVLWAGKTGHREVIRVHFRAGKGRHGYIDCTPEHLIRMADGNYVEAQYVMDYIVQNRKPHSPKHSCLAISRLHHTNDKKDRIFATGQPDLLEHRFVWEQVHGPIPKGYVVHHINGQHHDHRIENLQIMPMPEHSCLHGCQRMSNPTEKQKATQCLLDNKHKAQPKYGWDNAHTWKPSIGELLRLIAKNKARIRQIMRSTGKDYNTIINACEHYGLEIPKRCHNHVITGIEYIGKVVDVYDLTVEDCHNFIANEICVHNSRDPNFQNIPTRDKEIKKLIRTAFIPRDGRQILELDFKGIEVSTAYMYHLDPTMKAYLLDPTKDMHRDMAMQLYILGPDEWNKPCRQGAKNKFVFPEFYGSYWKNVGADLWKYAALNKLRVGKKEDGPTIFEHLKQHGIPDLDAFLKHVEKIENHFWNERFSVYTQWKEDWIADYYKRGYFDSYTGFRYTGIMRRNEIINYAIQGSASHCLLWCLTQLQKWLERKNMKSLIIGQIHDSMVIDVVPAELDAVLTQVQLLVCRKLPMRFKWITIPLTIEAEIAPVDAPWLEKAETDIKQYRPAV